MDLLAHWPIYLCDACEDEYGPADPGDTACCGCGRHDAGHIYVPDAAYQGAVLWLEVVSLREQLRGAVEERDVFARALRIACGSRDVRESCVRQAEAAIARERGQ